jgi:hypothetical protein
MIHFYMHGQNINPKANLRTTPPDNTDREHSLAGDCGKFPQPGDPKVQETKFEPCSSPTVQKPGVNSVSAPYKSLILTILLILSKIFVKTGWSRFLSNPSCYAQVKNAKTISHIPSRQWHRQPTLRRQSPP